jgi:hypothetical protein
MNRVPAPVRIESDTGPEKFAEISLGKHKSIDTEDHVHMWYGAIKNFRTGVTDVVHDDLIGKAQTPEYYALIERFPMVMIPKDSR